MGQAQEHMLISLAHELLMGQAQEHMLMGLAHEHMLMGLAHEHMRVSGKVRKPFTYH